MIYHFKSLVLVRKGRAFYTTLYQEVFFGNPGGGRVLKYALSAKWPIQYGTHVDAPFTRLEQRCLLTLTSARSKPNQPTCHRAPVEGDNPEPHLSAGRENRYRRTVLRTFSSRWTSSTVFVVGISVTLAVWCGTLFYVSTCS